MDLEDEFMFACGQEKIKKKYLFYEKGFMKGCNFNFMAI
jgi:hypothetical protein